MESRKPTSGGIKRGRPNSNTDPRPDAQKAIKLDGQTSASSPLTPEMTEKKVFEEAFSQIRPEYNENGEEIEEKSPRDEKPSASEVQDNQAEEAFIDLFKMMGEFNLDAEKTTMGLLDEKEALLRYPTGDHSTDIMLNIMAQEENIQRNNSWNNPDPFFDITPEERAYNLSFFRQEKEKIEEMEEKEDKMDIEPSPSPFSQL